MKPASHVTVTVKVMNRNSAWPSGPIGNVRRNILFYLFFFRVQKKETLPKKYNNSSYANILFTQKKKLI